VGFVCRYLRSKVHTLLWRILVPVFGGVFEGRGMDQESTNILTCPLAPAYLHANERFCEAAAKGEEGGGLAWDFPVCRAGPWW
jgi:hypothetical protein